MATRSTAVLLTITVLFTGGLSSARAQAESSGTNRAADSGDSRIVLVRHVHEQDAESGEELGDLTFRNLFSAGWDEKFEEREKTGRAVRIRYFRTRPAFLEREIRFNFSYEKNGDAATVDEYEAEAEFEIALNRRFQVELEPEYTWLQPKAGNGTDWASWTARTCLQLVDTATTAMNVQFSLGAPPQDDFGTHRTRFGIDLAYFRDLGGRVSLQTHVGTDFFTGAAPGPDDPTSQFHYAVALGKTLTEDLPLLENFTVFCEAYATTNVDGARSGESAVSLIPGVRWELGRDWWVAAGIEVPVSHPHPYDQTVHVALVKDFD